MKISHIEHLGIAVNSIEEALPYYENVLGLKCYNIETVEDQKVKTAFLKVGDTKIELLEPTCPESTIAKFIEKKGVGVHHVAFAIEDGVANALLLPYVMEYNAESPAAPKYIKIAEAMGVNTVGMTEAEGVKAAIEAVRELSLSIGIPQKLHEIGVREEDLHQLAVDAYNDVCTGGNPRPTSVEDIEALYHKAF